MLVKRVCSWRSFGGAVIVAAVQFLALHGCGARTGLYFYGEREAQIDSGHPHPDAAPDTGKDVNAMDHVVSDVVPPDADSEPPDTGLDAPKEDGEPPDTGLDAPKEDGEPPDTGLDAPDEDAMPEAGVNCAEPGMPRCGPGLVCRPGFRCVPGALAVDGTTTLYAVELPSGIVTPVAKTGTPIDDIAFRADGTLYGGKDTSLYQIDPVTGQTTFLVPLLIGNINALGVSSDHSPYCALRNGNAFFKINPSGSFLPLGFYPAHTPRYVSSGDIATVGATAFQTIAVEISTSPPPPNPESDVLVTTDLSNPSATATTTAVVGSIGFNCVEGLVALNGTLFGFTCKGELLRIDSATGAGTLIAHPGTAFAGAAAR